MVACIIFVLYTCPDVGSNTRKQMASLLSSRFNKIVVKFAKKRTLHVQKNKENTRYLLGI